MQQRQQNKQPYTNTPIYTKPTRRPYTPPRLTVVPVPLCTPKTPLPQRETNNNSSIYIAAVPRSHSYHPPMPETPRPEPILAENEDYYFMPAIKLPQTNPRQRSYFIPNSRLPTMPPLLPQTPMPFAPSQSYSQNGACQEIPIHIAPPQPVWSFPSQPPCSIPGIAREEKLQEGGVAESLLGCATLLVICLIGLAILYYLSM